MDKTTFQKGMTFAASWFTGRHHPDYLGLLAHWRFIEQTYNGGRKWFDENIHKYSREGDNEHKDRIQRAYRFNHTREIVDLVTKYVFKGEINRSEDAPEELKTFWKRATRDGQDVTSLFRQLSRGTSLYGQPAIVIDSTAKTAEEGGPVSMADQEKSGARVYGYMVPPQDILNMSFDEHGELNWILYRETVRDDETFFSDFVSYEAYRLWTREQSFRFKVRKQTDEELRETAKAAVAAGAGNLATFKPSAEIGVQPKEVQIAELDQIVDHNLGMVPVILAADRDSDSPYSAPALVDDIAYLDRANANYLSNLDEIIQDQTFSVLTIPAQSLTYGDQDSTYSRIVELGTKRIFAYDAEGGAGPTFISPDPSQAQIILAVITKIITEIYHSVGMAGERTKMDNAAGIDNSSGVAKAYDFDRMNTMLKAKADRLAWVENRAAQIVMAWHGKALPETVQEPVQYPDEFDTRNLYDEFDVANRLTLLDAPESLRRHQVERLIDKLFPNITRDLKAKIQKELEDWPKDEEVELTNSKEGLKDRTVPKDQNKQGQNNKDAGQD